MRWDLFCRVIDNYGDIGVCWRLARDLARRGETVRLWVDDASALAWMAPHGEPGVQVLPWTAEPPELAPGEVVVEGFGCDPPAGFVAAMRADPPLWINLEYLSAEDYVERSHRLPSPQFSGPASGLTKWFFYPGFTPRTGGLLREPGLMAKRERFDRAAWLDEQGIAWRPGERLVSLFCYDSAPVDTLLERLAAAGTPTLLLLTPGAAQRRAAEHAPGGALRLQPLPWLAQDDYDCLLWSCDLNFVRGEDSFVRAQWAGQPFVWQIYPQHDDAHAAKLGALLDRLAPAATVRQLWCAWNGLGDWPAGWPSAARWSERVREWREHLLTQEDLTTQLLHFVAEKRLK
jgi:uncharacterized repeat protein (TIGR03837 family)